MIYNVHLVESHGIPTIIFSCVKFCGKPTIIFSCVNYCGKSTITFNHVKFCGKPTLIFSREISWDNTIFLWEMKGATSIFLQTGSSLPKISTVQFSYQLLLYLLCWWDCWNTKMTYLFNCTINMLSKDERHSWDNTVISHPQQGGNERFWYRNAIMKEIAGSRKKNIEGDLKSNLLFDYSSVWRNGISCTVFVSQRGVLCVYLPPPIHKGGH